MSTRLSRLHEKIKLHGDDEKHEQTDTWSNRDLIPLPPLRRTWGWFHYLGYWALASLNVNQWTTPATFLSQGLSVRQSMMVIVVGGAMICFFSILIAFCGFTWHVGYTVQNRFSWGLRGSYIPLLHRVFLNFIWTAYQCWTGGGILAVAITAIWPSFATIHNTFPSSFPATTYSFIGFVLFWLLSLPFLWIPPERFKLPFQVVCTWCTIGMISMLIWACSTSHGLGPLFYTGQTVPQTSRFSIHWIIMSCINQNIGGIKAAGITNSSDFSRYGRSPKHYIFGTILSAWVIGTAVCLIGLVVTSICQVKYGAIYWYPPELLMVMMDYGHGSVKARVGCFFLSLGFALTSMFENVCGNAVAGGIDLAGVWPRYINIRRGAIITFVACWVVQPWQLVNNASTFIAVMSSFSVFLAPIMGIMSCDFYLLRQRKIKLTDLYHPGSGDYWYWHGVNLRVIPAWLCGWAPTIGGLVVTVNGNTEPPKALLELYYMAFLIGFFISATIFFVLNKIWPPPGLGAYDELDHYGTFTEAEAAVLGVRCFVPSTELERQNFDHMVEKETVTEKIVTKD